MVVVFREARTYPTQYTAVNVAYKWLIDSNFSTAVVEAAAGITLVYYSMSPGAVR